ncbi:MAG: aminotransferase class IV [Phycisphaerae bacterium]|nr:aminotransferase class IV [Phycisphaerae bacterium]
MKKVFFNDKVIDKEKVCIGASNTGFLHGCGLFETMRVNNGIVFRLDDHLERLFKSARTLNINMIYDMKYLMDAVYKVIEANNADQGRLRLTYNCGFESSTQPQATLLITMDPLNLYSNELYEKGAMVTFCDWRQSAHDPLTGHKSTSYLNRMFALQQAKSRGAVESLWFTAAGRLAEGSITNVFLVKDNVIVTPDLDTPVLPGIARKTVCEIIAREKLDLEFRESFINDILEADEIFITNVLMQVMPVVQIEKHFVADKAVGPVTKKLSRLFTEEFLKKTSR